MASQHAIAKAKLLKHVRGASDCSGTRARATTAQVGAMPKTPTREAKKPKKKNRQPIPDTDEIVPGEQNTKIPRVSITSSMRSAIVLIDSHSSEEYAATPGDLKKYTPQGAKHAREMNKFEDVFQTPSSSAGNGSAAAPFEVFDIAPPRPLHFRGRRGFGMFRQAPCSPKRRSRSLRNATVQKLLEVKKRKREAVGGDAVGGEEPKEREKRPKLMLKLRNPDKAEKQGN